jgi:non-canonical purine NTP pyrophosphatase (RdgB/HAM1 family)
MELILVFATNNEHKLNEVRQILPSNFKILSLKDAGIFNDDIEENGTTYKENSLIKGREISKLTKFPVIADDSGLEIAFLGKKMPGIYTKRFSIEHNGQENTNKFLSEKASKCSNMLNKAKFTCVISLINYKGKTKTFKGVMKGKIAQKTSGFNGFGYDPIFIPKGFNKTVAELPQETKNMISHRYHALKKLVKYLSEN